MSLLVIFEVLGLFANTLNVDDKYFLPKSKNLPQPIQMQLPNQQKSFPECFAPFLKSTSNFLIFSKKRWPSQLLYSWNYRLSITWLDKYLKSPVSEHRFSVNMLKGPKGCWNLHGGTFIIFLHPFEGNKFWKYLS